NVVTEPDGVAGAILIRAVDMPGGDGPGKLCKNWQIDRSHNNLNLMDSSGEIWLSEGIPAKNSEIGISQRVGISVAQDRLFRFFIKEHPLLSVHKVRSHKAKNQSRAKAND
ncbi:MAG: DNA-3-methyladenine glycosylase, partial [Candidatus Obscuribacterales bacterium]|nr:DNA-3-methyladenine glycosylase [Candidatus Obscuribacterales bacterium]